VMQSWIQFLLLQGKDRSPPSPYTPTPTHPYPHTLTHTPSHS